MWVRSINKWNLLATAIAGMVGSGWLFGPYYAAKIAGPAAILSWLVAGCLMMVVAYTFIEITRRLPVAGGLVRFFQLGQGDLVGFCFSWVAWLAWLSVSPIETMAVVQYAASYWPSLMHRVAGEQVLTLQGISVATLLMMLICSLNCLGLRVVSKTNSAMLVIKLGVPMITALLLMRHGVHMTNLTQGQGFMATGLQGVVKALPTAGVIYSFIGFNPAIQLAAEVKDPKKTICFAVLGALIICIVLYVVLQFAFIVAMDPRYLVDGWQHLRFPGDQGPFAGMLSMMGAWIWLKVVYLDAAVSPFGTALVQAGATSRLTFGMSENAYLPQWLQDFNRHHVPYKAIVANTVVGLLFFLPFPSWHKMLGFLVSCLVFGYVVGPMSLMSLWLQKPQEFSCSKVTTMVMCVLAFYICNLIIVWTGWATIEKMMIVVVIGYALLMVMIFCSQHKARWWSQLQCRQIGWLLPYLVGLSVISYCSSFGGIGLLPFGWDFLIIALFSIAIFYLSMYLQLTALVRTRSAVWQQIETIDGAT